MTAHLILTSLALTALLCALRGRAVPASGWMAASALLLLPGSYGPFFVISHYIFEITPAWLQPVGLGVCAVLLAAVLRRLGAMAPGSTRKLLVLACAGMAVGLVVGLRHGAHESGPTPALWDAASYVTGWMAAVLALLSLCLGLMITKPARWGRMATGLALLALLGCTVMATLRP